MTKLKLSVIADEKPVKITLEVPAELERDLRQYAEILAQQENAPVVDRGRLIVAMVQRFIQTDRGFSRSRRSSSPPRSRE